MLKRLSDAERDGDRIHAVIRSVAGSSDGKGRSVLPPSEMGETLAMRRALAAANVHPTSVDYVECHGTGTALGDVVETKSTHNAYGEGRGRPILIGSVKSNIGHLNAAAGVAGMIKVMRAMQEGLHPALAQERAAQPEDSRGPRGGDGQPPVARPRRWSPAPRRGELLRRRWLQLPRHPGGAQGAPPSASGKPRARARADGGCRSSSPWPGADARACLAQLDALCEQQGAAGGHAPHARGPLALAVTARTREELRKKRDFLRKAVEAGGDLEPLGQSGIFAAGPDSPLRGAPVAITFPGRAASTPTCCARSPAPTRWWRGRSRRRTASTWA